MSLRKTYLANYSQKQMHAQSLACTSSKKLVRTQELPVSGWFETE